MPPDFVVLSLERPEGERFAMFRPDDWLRSPAPSQWGSPEKWFETMEQYFRALELLTEDSMRARLEAMGLDEESVAHHIARARNLARMNKGVTWEAVTGAGYRNDEGQEVVTRTARAGSEPGQRVFLMRCTVCGHEYGTDGCDIPRRCCPNCQDGPPGFSR